MIDTLRCGTGFDVHRLVPGRKLILGGVTIPHEFGLDGHSDADVLVHAIMDALLGAAALGDIGSHFPDTSADYKNIDSILLLKRVYTLLTENGYRIINIDSTLLAEAPKLMPHAEKMRANISTALGNLPVDRIGIKATTTESCGFVGRKEAIVAQAAALIVKN